MHAIPTCFILFGSSVTLILNVMSLALLTEPQQDIVLYHNHNKSGYAVYTIFYNACDYIVELGIG